MPSVQGNATQGAKPPPLWRKPSVLLLLALCLGTTTWSVTYYSWHLFTAKHRPLVRGIDSNYYFFWLQSAVIDHDLDFTNQIVNSPTITDDQRAAELSEPLTPAGRRYNKFPIGWALTSAPWFGAAHLVSLSCGWGTTGWELPYQLAIWLGQLLYAWLGLWFAWRVLAHFFTALAASWAVLLGWLASPLVYYQTAGLCMTHSVIFSLVAAALWLSLKISENPRRRWFLFLGFVSGLLLVTRYTTVVYLFFPLLCLIGFFQADAPTRSKICRAALLVAGALPPILLQLWAWKIVYGSWVIYSYGDEGFQFLRPHLWDVLFSPLHGFFYWHPLMAVGIAGLCAWSTTDKKILAWLASFLAAYYLNSAWWCWWFGGSFGGRAFEGSVLLAMGGLAWVFSTLQSRPKVRSLVLAAALLAAAWNLCVLALTLTKKLSNSDAITWTQIGQAILAWFR
jgi:hypothetical protein